MRLLHTTALQLREFFGSYCPAYAILSHSWGSDEVFIEDIQDGVEIAQLKKGFTKIAYACKQAQKDGFEFVWIDTCCINKSSSAELSEAINSMFDWYQNAAVCYAYLSDVRSIYESSNENAFRGSRWYRRGWTLQELIAPPEVEFFDEAWNYIASRSRLTHDIASITRIDVAILKNSRRPPLASYSVAQRMSWAAGRQTTRPEDIAYSLLGVFGVTMPLLYGEGSRAFGRLQEEIMKTTADLSVLAWSPLQHLTSGTMPRPLSSTIAAFDHCDSVINTSPCAASRAALSSEITLTNVALRISAPVIVVPDTDQAEPQLAMLLNCRHTDDITTIIGLKISTLSHISAKDAMQHDTIRCLVGWPTDSEQDRLVRVDALDAARASVDKTIILEREGMKQRPGTLELMHRPRDWTRLWLRFDDATLNTAWSTLDVTPSQYWHYSTRTFDLTKARLEKYRRDKQGVAARTGSVFGLPIHGAIALKNKQGLQVTISFCQRNASLEGGITYDVTPYDAKMFKSPDQRMLDRNMGTTHGLKLPDGSSFEVALSAEEISEHMVAHLAVTLSNSEPRSREASVLRGSSRRRNPLDLIRKSRGGNAVAKDTQSIASNAR